MQNQQQQVLSLSGVGALGGGGGFGGGSGGGSWAGLSPVLGSLVEFPELEVKRRRKKRKEKRRSSLVRDGAVSSAGVFGGDDSGPESEYSLENGLSWNRGEVSKTLLSQQQHHEVRRERELYLDRNDGELRKPPHQVWRLEEQKPFDSSVSKGSKRDHKKEGKKQEQHTEIFSDTDTNAGRKRKRKEIETAVPWTEEMVQYLFETYDDVHRRLWIESRGKVKNQKKWDPIIKTMRERFRREFTKNQCESKYWKVRRECTKYKTKLEKRAAETDHHYPGKAVGAFRELLKPKFFDVWFEVSGKSAAPMPEIELSSDSAEMREMSQERAVSEKEEQDGEHLDHHHDHHRHKHNNNPGCGIVLEMQEAISMQLEASEKREEALNIRAELTMELLRQHMERMERTGSSVEDARRRQLHMIEGVDNKLDRLVQGLNALNGNIGALIGRLQALNQSHK
ncbi:unnamed protein product [Sphagnum balticum]